MVILIKSEFQKLRRCNMLLVGILAATLCPLVQYGSNLIMNPELRDMYFTWTDLFDSVIGGNMQVFFPISFVMIGAWMIDREARDDTLKNVLTVPLSWRKIIATKLCSAGLLALLFGAYSFIVSCVCATAFRLPDFSAEVMLHGFMQIVGTSFGAFYIIMPLIVLFGKWRGAYLGGSVVAFLYSYCMLFFKSGPLRSIYPPLAALALTGYDTESWIGAESTPQILLCVMSLIIVGTITAVLIFATHLPNERSVKKKANPPHGARRPRR